MKRLKAATKQQLRRKPKLWVKQAKSWVKKPLLLSKLRPAAALLLGSGIAAGGEWVKRSTRLAATVAAAGAVVAAVVLAANPDGLIRGTRGLRRLGSAALDMAWTACGRVEGFYEYGLNPWDVAAGAIIVQEAGGIVTEFKQIGGARNGRERSSQLVG